MALTDKEQFWLALMRYVTQDGNSVAAMIRRVEILNLEHAMRPERSTMEIINDAS